MSYPQAVEMQSARRESSNETQNLAFFSNQDHYRLPSSVLCPFAITTTFRNWNQTNYICNSIAKEKCSYTVAASDRTNSLKQTSLPRRRLFLVPPESIVGPPPHRCRITGRMPREIPTTTPNIKAAASSSERWQIPFGEVVSRENHSQLFFLLGLGLGRTNSHQPSS